MLGFFPLGGAPLGDDAVDAAAAGVTGTIAATSPVATLAASGTHTAPSVTGTIAAEAPVATASASGAHGVAGAIAASAPVATLAASGARGAAGTISAEAPVAVAAFAGTAGGAAVTGTISATAPVATAEIAGFTPLPTIPVRGAAGDNPRRKRGRTWTLTEWQEEQRRRREPPAGLLHDVEIPQAPQPIPTPRGLSMPTGALAGLIPPRPLPASLIPRPVPVEWHDDEEDLELLLLA